MQGRQIAIVIAAGLVAFGVAFGAGKASGGGESTAAPSKNGKVALESVTVEGAKVTRVESGGALASFKPARKKKKAESDDSSSPSTSSPSPAPTSTPNTSTPAPAPTSAPAPAPTQAPEPPPKTGGGETPVTGGGQD